MHWVISDTYVLPTLQATYRTEAQRHERQVSRWLPSGKADEGVVDGQPNRDDDEVQVLAGRGLLCEPSAGFGHVLAVVQGGRTASLPSVRLRPVVRYRPFVGAMRKGHTQRQVYLSQRP